MYGGKIKENHNEGAKLVSGFKNRPKYQWLSDEMWQYIEKCKQAKLLLLPNCGAVQQLQCVFSNLTYQYHDKMGNKGARKDKHSPLEKKAKLAEEAAKRGDSKTAYRLTNEIVGKHQNIERSVLDLKRRLATDPEDMSKVKADHFQTLLNRLSSRTTNDS